MIRYQEAPDVAEQTSKIISSLNLKHIDKNRLKCFRSYGSQSNAVARCYALGKIWQAALKIKAHYIIEVISERFDRLSEPEKQKTLIHELLHIPRSFGGGFRHHDFACKRNVDALYKKLKSNKAQESDF